jgi:hypothetical protein
MDPVMTDRCAGRGPKWRIRQRLELPDPACPVRYCKVGRPYHFSAVAASNEFTLRTPNAAVTKNSADYGRGFWLPTAWCECAGAHVTTTLRLPVTRAAGERSKVGASFHSSWHPLAVGLFWRAGRQGLLFSCSPLVAARDAELVPCGTSTSAAQCQRAFTVPISAQAVPTGAARDHRARPAPTLRRAFCSPRRFCNRFVGHSPL